MYHIQYDTTTGRALCIIRETDGASIPFDPMNADYQQYVVWLNRQSDDAINK